MPTQRNTRILTTLQRYAMENEGDDKTFAALAAEASRRMTATGTGLLGALSDMKRDGFQGDRWPEFVAFCNGISWCAMAVA
jgi:hypothetical protein